jgi:tetratricopeptide (TPR) repeat protein
MKRSLTVLFVLILLLFPVSVSQAQTAVTQKNVSVKISTGAKQVKTIYVNLTDWEIKPVIAKNTVGATESLADMAKRTGAEAAINGTFFNSYSDMQPHGTIQTEYNLAHLGTNGTTVGVTYDNKVLFESLFIGIEGSINDSYEWPFSWYAWGINHNYTDANAIVIYTPAKGKTAGSNTSTAIIVKAGVVTEIRKGVVNIPADGFVITANSGSSAQQVANKFKVGDRVSYRYFYKQGNKNGADINWDNVRHSLGAGPRLLTAGKITVDFKKEGMNDPKITTNKGSRSFIGVDKNGLLVIGTVSSVTVRELAEAAQKLGLMNAMNLDGGASSGLYHKGKYLTTPGRLLSNSLVVVKRTKVAAKQPSNYEQALRSYRDGKVLEGRGDLAGAKEKYRTSLKLYELPDTHIKLGLIYDKENDYDAAINHLEKSIELNPRNPAPYSSVGWLYYKQNKYTEAIAAFERLIAADYNSRAQGYYGIGLCYSSWQMQEYDKAREYFQKAVEADPKGTVGRQAQERINRLPG